MIDARLPMRVNSAAGRTEYLLVGLVEGDGGFVAYPMGKGSGSVTTFSHADGFIAVDQHVEILEPGTAVDVQLLGARLEPADLVVIGSHCVGLDIVLGEVARRGLTTKVMHVGSLAGLAAAQRGECDIAGIHLLDEATGEYNRPLLTPEVTLIEGYRRMQGMAFRKGDDRFEYRTVEQALAAALEDPECSMINRNQGSGTRILIDRLLDQQQPPGYAVQAKSHNAVAAAIQQSRADWGVVIDTVAHMYDLLFLPLCEEHYDFVVPVARRNRPEVEAFAATLRDAAVRARLQETGFCLG